MVFGSVPEKSIGKTHHTTRGKLPDFDAMREGNTFVGSKITSTGLIAKIGKYLLIITEISPNSARMEFPCWLP